MNRPIALMILAAALASSQQVQSIRADQPTPAVRVAKAPNSREARPVRSDSTRVAPGRETGEERLIGAGVKKPQDNSVRRATASSQELQMAARERGQRPVRKSGVVPASAEFYQDEVVHEAPHQGEYIVNEGAPVAGHGGCSSCGDGGCDGSCSSCGPVGCGPVGCGWGGCGIDLCNPGCGPGRQLCICLPSHGWVQLDYLNWYQSGMNVPPLLTTSANGTAQANAGVLGLPTTSILIGNKDLMTDRRDGFRIRFGWWFANRPNLGIEGEYLGLSNEVFERIDRSTGAVGSQILARPFFNIAPAAGLAREDSELVAFPNVVSGSFTTRAESQFDGGAVRFRRALCCGTSTAISPFNCSAVPTQSRIDATLGWRYFQLNESLSLTENLTSLRANEPGTFLINDRFRTLNQFNGVEMGVLWQGRRGYWSLDALMRLSVGNVKQTVNIRGNTTSTVNGVATNTNGGLYAQRTNIGDYTRNKFAIAPELGATLGYQLTQRWRLTAGYSFIYWSNVVRPGDQIDTDLNPNLLPPETNPFVGALRPRFTFRETDYWVQGVNLGAEYRW